MIYIFRINSFLRQHKVVVALIILCVGGFVVYRATRPASAATEYILSTVKKGTVIASVVGTGVVSPVNQIDIQPQTSGMIVAVKAKVGDIVKAGQILVVLDQRQAWSSVRQAQASLDSARANLKRVLAGTPTSDRASAQTTLDSAHQALDRAIKNVATVKSQQDIVVAQARASVMNAGLTTVTGPTNRTTLSPIIAGSYSGSLNGVYIVSLYDTQTGLRYSVQGLETGDGEFRAGISVALGSRGLYIQFPTGTYYNGDLWTIDVPNIKSTSYLSAKSSYENSLITRDTQMQNAQDQIVTLAQNVRQAQAMLETKMLPPEASDVASAQAQVLSAETQLSNAYNTYKNTLVRAPFTGKIASLNAVLGAQAGGSSAIATLITDQLVVTAPFNEVDVAKIKVGQKSTITFDAVQDLSISGKVAEVQMIGTVAQGIVNYQVKLALDSQDARIKPAMSARAAIVTDMKQNILVVPNASLKRAQGQTYLEMVKQASAQDGESFVLGKEEALPARTSVQIGLTSDSVTEITNGVKEGDRIVVQTIFASARTASASGANAIRIPGVGGVGVQRSFGGGIR